MPKRTRSQKALLYLPGEPLPKPKYPGRYNKPHQDMLRAFSFGTVGMAPHDDPGWGRKMSTGTDVSPMGSAAVSRRESEGVGPGVERRAREVQGQGHYHGEFIR